MMTCAIFERQSQQVKKTQTAFTSSLFVDLKILGMYMDTRSLFHGIQISASEIPLARLNQYSRGH